MSHDTDEKAGRFAARFFLRRQTVCRNAVPAEPDIGTGRLPLFVSSLPRGSGALLQGHARLL